eukprot:UN4235
MSLQNSFVAIDGPGSLDVVTQLVCHVHLFELQPRAESIYSLFREVTTVPDDGWSASADLPPIWEHFDVDAELLSRKDLATCIHDHILDGSGWLHQAQLSAECIIEPKLMLRADECSSDPHVLLQVRPLGPPCGSASTLGAPPTTSSTSHHTNSLGKKATFTLHPKR